MATGLTADQITITADSSLFTADATVSGHPSPPQFGLLTVDTTLYTADTILLTADMTQIGVPPVPPPEPGLAYPFLTTFRGSTPQLYTTRVPAHM